jgi:hypothetical protein
MVGVSASLTSSKPSRPRLFKPLEDYHRSFSFAYGGITRNSKVVTLEVTDGQTFQKLRDTDILKMFIAIKVFAWWWWTDARQTLRLYFTTKKESESAENWMRENWKEFKVWRIK